ncbi:hypothetical protein HDU83_006762 [Entophlyctis luteolus]|nr:hypothetical protein HDU83_006762 [Entophlyctis luteolus]
MDDAALADFHPPVDDLTDARTPATPATPASNSHRSSIASADCSASAAPAANTPDLRSSPRKTPGTRRRSSFGLVRGIDLDVPLFKPGIWVDSTKVILQDTRHASHEPTVPSHPRGPVASAAVLPANRASVIHHVHTIPSNFPKPDLQRPPLPAAASAIVYSFPARVQDAAEQSQAIVNDLTLVHQQQRQIIEQRMGANNRKNPPQSLPYTLPQQHLQRNERSRVFQNDISLQQPELLQPAQPVFSHHLHPQSPLHSPAKRVLLHSNSSHQLLYSSDGTPLLPMNQIGPSKLVHSSPKQQVHHQDTTSKISNRSPVDGAKRVNASPRPSKSNAKSVAQQSSTARFKYKTLPPPIRITILSYLSPAQLARFRVVDALANSSALWTRHLHVLAPGLARRLLDARTTRLAQVVDVLRAQNPSPVAAETARFWRDVVDAFGAGNSPHSHAPRSSAKPLLSSGGKEKPPVRICEAFIAYAVLEVGKRVMNGLRCGACHFRPRVKEALWCVKCGFFACGPKNYNRKCTYQG